MAVLGVIIRALAHLNVRGYLYVWANMLWFVLSLPILTAPAAWAGLVRFSHAAQTQPQVSLEDFWIGFRLNLWRGLVISLLTIAVVAINAVNLAGFQAQHPLVTGILRAIWLGAIGAWLGIQLYLWPVMEEMTRPTLIGGLRNTLVMILHNPLFTLGLWLASLLVAVISTVFFPSWFLLTGSTLAVLGTSASLDRLQAAKAPHDEQAGPPNKALN